MTPTLRVEQDYPDAVIDRARERLAYELVRETVELHGPTHPIAAVAYAYWALACEQHECAEREYQSWLRAEGRKVVHNG